MTSKLKYRNIYVAATNQHIGKTTSTLGLVAAFISRGLNVGYCKPVGQRYLDFQNLKVDKDTILFADLIKFPIIPEIHSPVILGPGATAHYLDNPELYDLPSRVRYAEERLSAEHEVVIYEGTGHPGSRKYSQSLQCGCGTYVGRRCHHGSRGRYRKYYRPYAYVTCIISRKKSTHHRHNSK